MLSSNTAILAPVNDVGPLLPTLEVTADGGACDHDRECERRHMPARGKTTANDKEWVADVKRWCLAGTRSGTSAALGSDESGDEIAVGYEAADPALQAHHWPDAPTTGR